MNKRANMTVVGAFVLVAIALLVTAIVVLGSGRLFRDTFTVVSLFDGSVQGLQIGAPVTFRGVQIGTVSAVRLGLPNDPRFRDPENTDSRIPVLYEIDKTLLEALGGSTELDETRVAQLVDQGLRAQLQTESFVTGRLQVTLDIRPDQPAVLDSEWDLGFLQIPAIPQPIEEIQQQVAEVFDRLAEVNIDSVLVATERMMNNFADLAEQTPMDEITTSLQATMSELDETMAAFRDIAQQVADDLDVVSESAAARAQQLESVFNEAEGTLIAVQGALDPESPLTIQLGQTLYELGNAARALRVLTEALEQNPSAILRGRPIPEGNR